MECTLALSDLPIELIGAIVAQVTSIGDLLCLRAVNHTFATFATPRAFSTFHVVNTPTSVHGFASLLACPELLPLVKTLIVHCEAGLGENKLVNRVEEDADARELRLAFAENISQLSEMTSLQDLEVHLFSGMVWQSFASSLPNEDMTLTVERPAKYFMLQSSVLDALCTAFSFSLESKMPSLNSLTIANLIPFPAPSLQHPGFENLMTRAQKFSLSVHALRFSGRHGEDMYSWFWSEMIPERFLEPMQPTLTTLSLFTDQPVGQFPAVDLSWLRFPHLQKLSLNGFMFNEQRLIEDFIVRHGRTLTHLTLDTCPIHIGGVQGAPPRPWSAILSRFTSKLSTLLNFEIRLRTGWGLHAEDDRVGMVCPYERCLTGYGYERAKNTQVPLAVLQADRVALRNLLRTVNGRRQANGLLAIDLPELIVS